MAGRVAILAIDLGSTNLKVGLIDARDGALLALERMPVAVDRPTDWWDAVATLTPAVLRAGRLASEDVRAIGVDGHGPTCVPAAADGTPVARAIPWSDARTTPETAELVERTGLGAWALSILPAALWLVRHEPDVVVHARWYLNTWEWLALRLTGHARRTRSAGQVLAPPEAAAAAGIDPSTIPPIVDAGTVVGGLREDVATGLGLLAGTPVVAGLNDAFAACLGVGLLEPGDAYDAGGSAGGFAVYTDRPVAVPGAFGGAAPVPDRWFVGGAMSATGRGLDWLADVTAVSTDALLAEAATVPSGALGLVFLPYLAGERSPVWDPAARGAFVGLTLAHRGAHLARAVLEASAFALRHVAEPIRASGIAVRELRVAGRPASSDLWNRIKADVTGVTVAVPAVRESALLGSAILAAVGIGRHASLDAAIRAMVAIDHRLEPDNAAMAVFDRLFGVYRDLSSGLLDISHRLDALTSDRGRD